MKSRLALSLVPVVFAAAVAACGAENPEPQAPVAPMPPPPPPPTAIAPAPGPKTRAVSLESVGLSASAMDKNVDPCNDFYDFACGTWLKTTEIPADRSRWGRGFAEIAERNENLLKSVLEDPKTSSTLVGKYYAACMDEAAIEKNGIKAIDPLRKLARGVHDAKTLAKTLGELHKSRVFALFDISDDQDAKDATKVIATLDQGGLGLPDRDYYTKDDDRSKDARKKYAETVEKLLGLAGYNAKAAKKAAEEILAFETELAKASKTRVERRDPKSLYNKIDRKGLLEKAPDFAWDAYFEALGAKDLNDVNVTSLAFVDAISKAVKGQKPEVWQRYLDWHVIRVSARTLPKAYVDAAFELEKSLSGQKEQRARWKRCVSATDEALGELLAQPFVEQRFGKDQKEAVEKMVYAIRDAFGEGLGSIEWMDGATKQKASEKLGKMAYLIGYPKKWRDYQVDVDAKSFAASTLSAHRWETKRRLTKIGKPLDREEWEMTPPTVNAYYNPAKNQMVFPAGILQTPFYGPKASLAVNLGGMGMVVGHELTHGFDDEGSQFDGDGNLKNWWEGDVRTKFDEKGTCVADQYGSYEPVPGVKQNGRLTLGENIADIGGVKLAFHAYRKLRAAADEVDVADGFTEDQQFFISVGQIWCMKSREEEARKRALTDPHSAPKFRVNGSLSDTPEFAQAFSCKEGTPMRPKKACSVW